MTAFRVFQDFWAIWRLDNPARPAMVEKDHHHVHQAVEAMPSTKRYVDFKAVKQAVSILDVLHHYGLTETLTPKGEDKLVGRCPIHKGSNKTQFQVSRSKNAWYCFGKCQGGGGILDFVAQMENTDIRGAALLIADWFNINGTSDDAGDQVEPEPVADSPSRSTGYIREMERELRQLLAGGDQDAVVRYFKEKCIESFRNGVEHGQVSPA